MSSLKDWYRYVDSKARSRPEETGSPERDRSAEEREEGRPPAETSAASGDGESAAGLTESEAAEIRAAAGLTVGEEGLDVWSGLFPQPRKPEPKPTTAPLRRPAARLDEVPPDLPFTRTPVDGPPPPQFELPEAGAAIPRFDEFVSPFTAEPASSAGAAPPSTVGQPSPLSEPLRADYSRYATSIDEPPGASTTAAGAALPPEAAAPEAGSAAHPPSDPEPSPSTAQREEVALAAAPEEQPEASDIWDGEDVEGEAGQVRWRSPFRLPGPGRTVSSGAPSPKPEPVVPRQLASAVSAEEQTRVEAMASEPTPPRPAPGTEAWERERVERLARTFRETLRALEESLAPPRTPVASPPAEEQAAAPPPALAESPKPETARERVEVTADRLSGEEPASPLASAAPVTPASEAPELTAAVSLPSAAPSDAPPVSVAAPAWQPPEPETVPAAEPPAPWVTPAESSEDEAAETVSASAAPGEDLPVSPPTRLPVSAATPDVLRNIEEAALIRQRLPQHMAMLLRIPTNEVAQNSYKSPFRETREDLIGRLLDPQLTLEEAARILGVCPTTVRRYTNRGMLHCHRTPGNQRRFRMSDVLQFLEQYGDRIDRAAEAKQMEAVA